MLRTRRGRGGERVKLVGAGERVERVELGGEGGEGGAGERGAGSECSLARRRGLGGGAPEDAVDLPDEAGPDFGGAVGDLVPHHDLVRLEIRIVGRGLTCQQRRELP